MSPQKKMVFFTVVLLAGLYCTSCTACFIKAAFSH